MKQESEFGKGLSYCLGLFLAHEDFIERFKELGDRKYMAWFNGAADHLFELQIPLDFSKAFQKRLTLFRLRCLNLRLTSSKVTKEDYNWALSEAKHFLLAIDRKNKIKCIKAKWD